MNDINEEFTFLWTDGSTVSYTNWVDGAPEQKQSFFDYYDYERLTDITVEVQEISVYLRQIDDFSKREVTAAVTRC